MKNIGYSNPKEICFHSWRHLWCSRVCDLISAADYRKIFTGLIFLKYISTAFEKKYAELVAEGDGFEDDPDAYEAENIFFVPPEIGTILDKAMITTWI